MKPLLILIRIFFVGIFWSIFFLEGIRVIMLTNWRFDILRLDHWNYAWDLWLSGWVIDDSKEWAFVLIILTFLPLWLTGWAALSTIKWDKIAISLTLLPARFFKKIFEKPVNALTNAASVKVVKKKKSYKEIRPIALREPVNEHVYDKKGKQKSKRTKGPIIPKAPVKAKIDNKPVFDHSLFQFDETDDDFEFDFDEFADVGEKPKPKAPTPVAETADKNESDAKTNNAQKAKNKPKQKPNKNSNAPAPVNNTPVSENKVQATTPNKAPANSKQNSNSTFETLKQKGYEIISGITIKNTFIDFIGVSKNEICVVINDKETGDWLADEERFNDEEPLWFSESSHRISPVRKLDITRLLISEKLKTADLEFDVNAYLVIQIGNIINAEDMFEAWSDLDINVTRIDRGTPKELKLFNKTLSEASSSIDKTNFEKIKKLIRSI